ncbi:MAG: sodium:alanine symporter family protein [Candidatus Aureabacteria bacterium]|nr:sodium:alanine symporter family protein [Candidatus Auribacterota bacterium]
MESLQILEKVNSYVWGTPTILLLVGTGIYLTIILKGIQFRKLFAALNLAFVKRKEKDGEGDISHFQALMTAMAATVGTGNIVGVATAIAVGGPGALFWMWVIALFGMATKYSEAILAVKYRRKDAKGRMCGGPMYYLADGLNMKWLGILFAVFTAIATFGIGNMVQSNSVADSFSRTFSFNPVYTGIILSVLTGIVIIGGIKSIARVSSFLTPFMVLVYVSCSMYVIFLNIGKVPEVILLILKSAFHPTPAVGGFAGAIVMQAVKKGVSRGIFSNESGMGSAAIAAAAAKTKSPGAQALVSMTQTFIDTIIVCSMTGFVIIVSGAWKSGQNGVELTISSFNTVLGGGKLGGYIVSFGLITFSFSTLIGWSYYGEKAMEFLFSDKVILPYRVVFCIFVYIGAVSKLTVVWTFSDIMNGLMIIPNLIALLGLSHIIVKESKKYAEQK